MQATETVDSWADKGLVISKWLRLMAGCMGLWVKPNNRLHRLNNRPLALKTGPYRSNNNPLWPMSLYIAGPLRWIVGCVGGRGSDTGYRCVLLRRSTEASLTSDNSGRCRQRPWSESPCPQCREWRALATRSSTLCRCCSSVYRQTEQFIGTSSVNPHLHLHIQTLTCPPTPTPTHT